MRTILNATLVWGEMYVPVGVATAAKRAEVRFRTLHNGCEQPIQMANWCPRCSVTCHTEDLVKGYEIAKGQFVVFGPDEMSALAVERSRMIELSKFVPRNELDMRMIEKSYYLAPNANLLPPYELTSQAMEAEKVVGIGKAALWGKEYPVAVESSGGVLLLLMLFCNDELVPATEIRALVGAKAKKESMGMARQFLAAKRGTLEEEDLHNVSRERTMAFIEAKAGGETIYAVEPIAEPKATVDIQDALQKSLALVGATV